jgi:hypothetical protein
MNNFEEDKLSLRNCEEIADIKNNPVVAAFITSVKPLFPFWGELADGVVNEVLTKSIIEKRKKLLDIILSDTEMITTDMSSDVECIISFKKTVEAVDRLVTNDKIVYFGNLFKNGYLNEERIQAYKFEEYFNIINSLSYRQLDLLALLHTYSTKEISCDNEKEEDGKRWMLFKEDACKVFDITGDDLIAILKSAEKSGLCKEVVGAIYGYHGGRFEATSLLKDFVSFVISKNTVYESSI